MNGNGGMSMDGLDRLAELLALRRALPGPRRTKRRVRDGIDLQKRQTKQVGTWYIDYFDENGSKETGKGMPRPVHDRTNRTETGIRG